MMAFAIAGLVTAPSAAQAQRKQDIIKREDIAASSLKDGNVYELIRSMRPQFLEKPRGVKSIQGRTPPLVVYVDGVKEVDVEALNQLTANMVEEIRYYDPQKAQDEFGSAAAGGAIVVRKIKGSPAPVVRDTTKPPLL
jgi:hypothetical protein